MMKTLVVVVLAAVPPLSASSYLEQAPRMSLTPVYRDLSYVSDGVLLRRLVEGTATSLIPRCDGS